MPRARLFLNHDAEYDWLIALEFGCVDDGVPADNWIIGSENFAYLLERPIDGRPLGFRVNSFSEFDVEDPELRVIWEGPRFDVPALGLTEASAGEIIVAARAFFRGESSVNREYFHAAVAEDDRAKAAELWWCCLQTGDSMAHYGLGYTLYELGMYHEAYQHLRAYRELVPSNEWAWCWYGKACEALGERDEAIAAYRRALELEQADGAEETDAAELLDALA